MVTSSVVVPMTSKDVGLSGRAEAERRIANKFKVGLEAAGATAAIEPALKAMGYSAKAGVSGVRALADTTRMACYLKNRRHYLYSDSTADRG